MSVVWDLLLGCCFFPFFKESFGDRNILFVKLYLSSVGFVVLGCYCSLKETFGDKITDLWHF